MSSLSEALNLIPSQIRDMQLSPVNVAVVDSGVDARVPDVKDRIYRACIFKSNPSEPDQVSVCELETPILNDDTGHGTAVAAIIGRSAPNSRISDIRVLDQTNTCKGETLIEGFRRAVESDAKIINMSLASKEQFSGPLADLCEQAYYNRQIVVASKRNMVVDNMGYPAEFSSVISVDIGETGGDYDGLLFLQDPPIEFAATGSVKASTIGGKEIKHIGTSFATPIVSSICALYLGAFPELTMFELKSILKHYAHRFQLSLDKKNDGDNS